MVTSGMLATSSAGQYKITHVECILDPEDFRSNCNLDKCCNEKKIGGFECFTLNGHPDYYSSC